MNDERFHELLFDSFLGELSREDQVALAVEIERRGEAGERARRDMEEILGAIALDASPEAPPVRLRERVLAGADGEAASRKAEPPVVPLHREDRSWLPWIAAGIAAVLVLFLGISNLQLRSRNDRLRSDLEAARERIAEADTAATRLAELRSDLELLAEPGSSVHALAGTGPTPEARARVFVDPATGRAILFAYDLPILQPDDVYELWAISDGTPRAAGTFRPGPEGRARLEITDRALLEGMDALAVTVEPAPGTEEPTGDMVLISSS
ncbi:MAG: anti-sigma factor domain-containing protein [Gemmatimonadota bacterium]